VVAHPRWLFQAVLEECNLKAELIAGDKECWYKVEHRDNPFRMGEDQQVIFYQAAKREFHGLGVIIAVPPPCKLGNKNHTKKIGVDVLYTEKFMPPISVPRKLPKLIWENDQLPNLFTGHFVGAVFPISDKDWANLEKICPRL